MSPAILKYLPHFLRAVLLIFTFYTTNDNCVSGDNAGCVKDALKNAPAVIIEVVGGANE